MTSAVQANPSAISEQDVASGLPLDAEASTLFEGRSYPERFTLHGVTFVYRSEERDGYENELMFVVYRALFTGQTIIVYND